MFRALQSIAFGRQEDPLCNTLRAFDVPLTTAECRACVDPCDLGECHLARYLIINFELTWTFRSRCISSSLRCRHGYTNAGLSQVLPSTGMFCFVAHDCLLTFPQIIISTGKSDWDKDITDDKNSLAAAMTELTSNAPPVPPGPVGGNLKDTRTSHPGLFLTSDSNRTSVLNGSHKTLCHEDDHETVLVFPDFTAVTEVHRSMQGAQKLWDSAINPSLGRSGAYSGKSILKTWVLPYSCVILLC